MAKANEQADGHKNGETVGEVVKMDALGRRFQIGKLYDYRNDSIVAGNKLFPCYFSLLHHTCEIFKSYYIFFQVKPCLI